MKNTIKVPWDIIISAIILTMFATAKVFAHDEGQCITDVRGNVFLSNGSWVKIVSHLTDAELQEFRLTDAELEELDLTDAELKKLQDGVYDHAHRKQYYDANDNPTSLSTEFFDKDGGVDKDEFYVDCPTASPAPPAPATITPPLPPQETPAPAPSPQKAEQKRSITQRVRESGASEEVIEEMTKQPQHVPRDPTCDTDFSVAGIICWNWQIEDRYQLIGFPVLPMQGIDDIGWLHYFFEWKLERHNLIFQVFVDERWLTFDGRNEANFEVRDIPITPHLAVMVNFKKSEVEIGVLGTPQQGQIINLEPGIHLIGLPEVPANFNRASDFLSVDGVEWVKIGYSSPQTIDSIDDPDDVDIESGQAIRISVTEDVTLDLRGSIPEAAAAPSVRRKGTLATSWGAMKRDDSR